jgi:hypothetical protein
LLDGLRVREREREGLQADLAHFQGLQRVGPDLDRGQVTTAMRAQLGDWHGALAGDPVLARQLLRKLFPERLTWSPAPETDGVRWSYSGKVAYGRLLTGPLNIPTGPVRTPIGRGWHDF